MKVKELVEKYSSANKQPQLIVVKIVDIKNHPNREDLHIVTVDDGNTKQDIVCGAQNVRKDMLAVFAPVGAILPKTGKAIKARSVAGIESKGMLCSGAELNISDDDKGIYEIADKKPGQVLK